MTTTENTYTQADLLPIIDLLGSLPYGVGVMIEPQQDWSPAQIADWLNSYRVTLSHVATRNMHLEGEVLELRGRR